MSPLAVQVNSQLTRPINVMIGSHVNDVIIAVKQHCAPFECHDLDVNVFASKVTLSQYFPEISKFQEYGTDRW